MSELLAPAGSMDALKAAVANGCDAVYLGMQSFGARAYSSNFDQETLPQAVEYAHLRGVKVYVTMNTIVFQDELPEARRLLHLINDAGADGVIVQDLALLDYVTRTFQDLEAHCSTQMGIDDQDGALMVRQLGAARTLIGREVSIDQVKRIRQQAQIPVETFVHGALCVSYSGNCIMSGMTGNRLGNRGRCIGSCRKLYRIQDSTTGQELGRSYILSTKDLCTIDHVDQLEGIDSLKIEGRMKEPEYVANVVRQYRLALDGKADPDRTQLLSRTFNRTFTPGYLFGEDNGSITNVERPNHHGYLIGHVEGFRKGMCKLRLTSQLRQNDVIRIRHDNQDVNLSVARLYDQSQKLINSAQDRCFIKVKERLAKGDPVFKTKDAAFTKELQSRLTGEYRRAPLDFTVFAYPGAPLVVDARGLGQTCTWTGDEPLSEAVSNPTDQAAAEKQLGRLNNTVFTLGTVDFQGKNAFVPAKMLNAARKDLVERLCRQALDAKPRRLRKEGPTQAAAQIPTQEAGEISVREDAVALDDPPVTFAPMEPILTACCTTQEQADACREAGVDVVYFRNVVPRNGAAYQPLEGTVLVGGLGGVHHYRSTNPLVTDYSLNVVNAQSAALLHRLGARRVTLSYEINQAQLQGLLASYQSQFGGLPRLEMIVYGHAPLLVTKYCPLKALGQCGRCRTHAFQIQDEFGTFPLLSHENCNTTVLNGKVLNLLDQIPSITGISAFRLQFTLESAQQVRDVAAQAREKLAGESARQTFDPKTQTRGFFNKEIM